MFLSQCAIRKAVVLVLSFVVAATTSLAAENHVVPTGELLKQIASAGQTRQTNLAKTHKFFSSEPAQRALRTARIDGDKVERAVALLSDEELARLASRTDQAQADLVGGALTNQEITYIIIALATAVLILVIVAAR
jgi:hypothetical protein